MNTPEAFNQVLTDFLDNLMVAFPQKKADIAKIKEDFEDLRRWNIRNPVEIFMRGVQPYITHVTKRDEEFFRTHVKDIPILQKVGFEEVWNDQVPEQNKESVWVYMEILTSAAMTIAGKQAETSGAHGIVEKIQQETNQYCQQKEAEGVNIEAMNNEQIMGMALDMVGKMQQDGRLGELFGGLLNFQKP